MNTRLQVEHPVTELVTGLDLVELMLRIAAGEHLPLSQADVRLEGWAIEARIYAEDPTRGFLPSTGRLVRYLPPQGKGLRLDDGVHEGTDISIYYDPMIAKLAAHGPDRDIAIDRLSAALDEFYIAGLHHNIPFLAAVVGKSRFRTGALSTHFITEEFPNGFTSPAEFVEADRMILLAAGLAARRIREREVMIDRQLPGAHHTLSAVWAVLIDNNVHRISVRAGDVGYQVDICDARLTAATDWGPGEILMRMRLGAQSVVVQIERLGVSEFRLVHGGVVRWAQVLSPRAAELLALMPRRKPADTSRLLLSPMPGLLASIAVSQGQEVKAGEALAIVEAMKMENVLRAERDGRVAAIRATPGDTLAVDEVILEFE
jgi:propionyl-CoA carboxylase alpha chain